jgi:putative hydrolase of the HAD superfamily
MSKHILAVCLDCGDTLVDESTEIKDERGVVLQAELIPGAGDMVRTLKQSGYQLALVADGPVATFRNVLTAYNLFHLFDAQAISEQVGVSKPDVRIFTHALDRLGIAPQDYGRVVMVGNNLGRDIKGANQLGLISVWLDWSPRRSKIPTDPTEIPQHTIKSPAELLPLLKSLEFSSVYPLNLTKQGQ